MDISMIQNYIKPELLVLIPVLYFIGTAIKKSKAKDNIIPFILGIISVILSALYIFSSCPVAGSQEIFSAIFTAITQGVLIAGASVYANQIVKQAENKTEKNQGDED